MAERSEAKKREAKLPVKIFKIFIFDAKLRFALLASLRSAIFSEVYVDNLLLVNLPARVNKFKKKMIVIFIIADVSTNWHTNDQPMKRMKPVLSKTKTIQKGNHNPYSVQ